MGWVTPGHTSTSGHVHVYFCLLDSQWLDYHYDKIVSVIMVIITISIIVFLFIMWSQESECAQVNYTVTLENSGGKVEDQMMEICGNGTVCSTVLTPSSMNRTYLVRITATNDFGESSSPYLSVTIG